MKENCDNCKFFDKMNQYGGHCRRYPPQIIGDNSKVVITSFPEVGTWKWCGEWKEKKEE